MPRDEASQANCDLEIAASSGDFEGVVAAFQAGASPSARFRRGAGPLTMAMLGKNPLCVEEVLRQMREGPSARAQRRLAVDAARGLLLHDMADIVEGYARAMRERSVLDKAARVASKRSAAARI